LSSPADSPPCFNPSPPSQFSTLSLHDALPIFAIASAALTVASFAPLAHAAKTELLVYSALEADQIKAYKSGFEKAHPEIELKFRSEEHTSELQSLTNLVCRLLLEKKTTSAVFF